MGASRLEQGNQAPREHTQPPPAQLVSREEFHSALVSMFHNIQDMFTSLLSQNKEETAMPSNAQHTNNTSRHNKTSCLSCQCDPLPKEQSPTSSVAPENTITTRGVDYSQFPHSKNFSKKFPHHNFPKVF